MAENDPVVIIGAGLAGAGAAWALTRRGLPVVVAEQFPLGHLRGSSHGSARIVRRGYGDGLYVSLTGRAFELWRELELASGTAILRMLGSLDFGVRRNVPKMARLLADAGVRHEVLPPAEAAARWPGMVFEGEVLFHEQAGTMDAAGAVAALLAQAAAAGAQVLPSTEIVAVADAGRRVILGDGGSVSARCTVVAAGGWIGPLLSGVVTLPPLRVTEQQLFHFPRRDPGGPAWPSVIHDRDAHAVYHLAGGRDGGPHDDRKIGEHDGGHPTTAAEPDGVVDPASRERVVAYVQRWLPGLEPALRTEGTCLYTETPSEDFVLDRVDDLVVCSPCSGHGAKFAPVIGEMVADLVTGADSSVPERFRLASHLSGRTASVSL
ncbi:MAG: FAD-dependent oxidoreductase [Jatrophihabitans sp.]|uniref:FAD-dependent oxidoreductase n=1 Tax=Jatrophihabitans sp. TaxID=1932789 RepID=UPI0039116362